MSIIIISRLFEDIFSPRPKGGGEGVQKNMISENFKAIKLKVASPEDMLSWSYGEVLKPETINYRTQRPEKDGLFSERIFGPSKDYECYCGKYRRIRYKGIVCDKCNVEVTKASVRRERMGHIELATPVAHIWFLRSIPSRVGLFLGVPSQKLERVIYYSAYIITKVDESEKKILLENLDKEFKAKQKSKDVKKGVVEELYKQKKEEIMDIAPLKVISEAKYFKLSREFGQIFEAGIGSEAIVSLLEKIDLEKVRKTLEKSIEEKKSVVEKRKLIFQLKLVRSFIKNKLRPEWLFLKIIPVLPPDLRPMVSLDGGRFATSDLNDLYRRVINRNNRLKKLLELKAPEVIVRNEKRMLQEAVDALIDNTIRETQIQMTSQKRPLKSLADNLKGKQGRFRQNLLGKRVDYSGRSVIVVGPNLPHYQCGLPKKMALELFRPFVVNDLIYNKELAHNIRGANKMIDAAPDEVWESLEEVIKGKLVLLNRAPTLHRLGIQAFEPILIEDLVVRIPPMVCPAFNADFDGDQMAVHLPLSDEAQKEAREKMLASHNFLKPSSGDPVVNPNQDIVLGCFYLTSIESSESEKENIKSFSNFDEAIYAYEFGHIGLKEKIRIPNTKDSIAKMEFGEITIVKDKERSIIETSLGRLMMNNILPNKFPYFNETANKKFLQKLTDFIGSQTESIDEAVSVIDLIKSLGFRYSMISGTTLGAGDLIVPKIKSESLSKSQERVDDVEGQYQEGLLSSEEKKSHVIQEWQKSQAEITSNLKTSVDPFGPVSNIINSGARGSWNQIMQMMGMKGFVQNPKGEIIEMPIKSCYKEGFDVLEYFIASHGARKGTSDTALKTANAGYLTRRLVDSSQDIVIVEENCRTKDGVLVERLENNEYDNFSERLFSRVSLEQIKIGRKVIVEENEIINRKAAELIDATKEIKSIKVRSPISCKSIWGICGKCYGLDLAYNKPVEVGVPVGVIAAQSIGEPGTQLTLRTFHSGGVAGKDITHGLPRIEELFEVTSPKYKATISGVDGEVVGIEESDKEIVVSIKPDKKEGKSDSDKKTDKKKTTKSKKKDINLITYSLATNYDLLVKKGDKVLAGDPITEGSIDLKELMKFAGRERVEKYIMDEIQKIYVSEGVNINNKHLEIILRQMFSKVKIKESGDSQFLPGDVISRSKLIEENRILKKEGKQIAKANVLLLGITRSALASDSFLSAASFQETTRVMVTAATEGKLDNLRGMKENVIIGRLIPAGTGFRKIETVRDDDV